MARRAIARSHRAIPENQENEAPGDLDSYQDGSQGRLESACLRSKRFLLWTFPFFVRRRPFPATIIFTVQACKGSSGNGDKEGRKSGMQEWFRSGANRFLLSLLPAFLINRASVTSRKKELHFHVFPGAARGAMTNAFPASHPRSAMIRIPLQDLARREMSRSSSSFSFPRTLS